MAFVVDCSVTMSWCFRDEATRYTEEVFDRLRSEPAVVPSIWPLEVVNTLLVAERRGRITQAEGLHFIQILQGSSITLDAAHAMIIMERILDVGRQHRLSAYDAAYLELATREGLPLATLDAQLRTAATKIGVRIIQ